MAQELKVETFINNADVKNCLQELDAAFPGAGIPFIVSDVVDNDGHQYVNLVQKGGGVLGIALVGYTYILEQMGIRFIRLAGTSAGAINTALMVAVGKKQEPKSLQVLDAICKLEFIKLVDGHPAARWLISKFITNSDFGKRVKSWTRAIVGTVLMLLVGNFVFLGLQHGLPWISVFTKIFFVLTGICLVCIGIIVVYVDTLFKRLKNSGFGINPGDFFYDWIKQQLADNGVKTVTDMINKASDPVPGLHLRVDNDEGLKGLNGDVTFICSDLVSKNKIQFPEMWNLFRKNIDELEPAGFIRASMSIPIFFESYFINRIPCTDEDIKKLWEEKLGQKEPPSSARFVDGGILSNFPINLFYNPKILVPRLPSFGIDLDDSLPGDEGLHANSWSLAGYFGRMFSTIRSYYDKDFLLKNKVFTKGIGVIKLPGYNWLNFFLSNEDKIDMFVKGAQAAKDFLIGFKWDDYKDDRDKMRKELLKEQLPTGIIPKN
jgi:NTE family protein